MKRKNDTFYTFKSKHKVLHLFQMWCLIHVDNHCKGYIFYTSNPFRQVSKHTVSVCKGCPVTEVSSGGTQPVDDEENQNPSESP